MPSSYTTNIAIEKPADGEQSNTWGTTVNDNMDIVDRITSQVGSIALSSTSYTLTTSTSGSLSEGHYSVIKFTGTPGGTCTVTISPNTIQRIYTIINATNQSVTMTQGSGGNVTILAGDTTVVYSDGAGSGAAVAQAFNSQALNDINITNSTINSSNIGASTPGTGNFTTLSLNGTAVTATAAELNILDGMTATTTELNYTDGVTSNIQTQLNAKAPIANASLTGTTTISALSLGGTTVTATGAELNVLDGITATTTELNYTDGVTSNIQTQLNAKAPTASPTFSGTTSVSTLSLGGTVITSSGVELNYSSGVTSNIQTQLNAKAASANSVLTGTTSIAALTLGGTAITATGAELNYTDGVTSNIQTQLNAKAPAANPTLTGTVTMTGANAAVKEVTETVYALSGTGPALDPGNGTIQTWTLSGNSTPTDSFSSGQSMTLMVAPTASTITWPSVSWVNNGGTAPTLSASATTVVVLWKVSTTLYGALVGDGT